MPRCVLVTGGAGFIGSHTVAALLEGDTAADLDIVVADNLSNAYIRDGETMPESLRRVQKFTGKTVKFYRTDMRDASGLEIIFKKHPVSCVIHFAGLKAVGESVAQPLQYYENNVTGLCVLLETMRRHGCHGLIFSSSCTVYGPGARLPVDERQPAGRALTCPYGRTKYFCEEIARDLCASWPELTVVSLRYFNPVGAHPGGTIGEDPADIPNNLMPYISQVAVGARDCLQVYGADYATRDGTGVRDYIHVMDLAEGHVRALDRFDQGDTGFQAINLGTGTGYSVLEMIAAFEKASKRKVPYRIVGRRAGDAAEIYANASLAESLLGWKATRGIDEMCRDTWNWQRQNPNGFRG